MGHICSFVEAGFRRQNILHWSSWKKKMNHTPHHSRGGFLMSPSNQGSGFSWLWIALARAALASASEKKRQQEANQMRKDNTGRKEGMHTSWHMTNYKPEWGVKVNFLLDFQLLGKTEGCIQQSPQLPWCQWDFASGIQWWVHLLSKDFKDRTFSLNLGLPRVGSGPVTRLLTAFGPRAISRPIYLVGTFAYSCLSTETVRLWTKDGGDP